MPPPGVITGGIQPLMESMTARPLRYRPVSGEFVIRNGKEFFNRPIYGVTPTSGDFRVDAGDKPEFSLYLPGHGGNLKLGFMVGSGSKWAADADEVIARYRPGRMLYEIRDGLLGKGILRAELLTTGCGFRPNGEGGRQQSPARSRLAWAFGGVSGRKGRRGGDIGCEVEPVSQFFQVREDECADTRILIRGSGKMSFARVVAKAAEIVVVSPLAAEGTGVTFLPAAFSAWNAPPNPSPHWDGAETDHPILTGSNAIKEQPLYLWLYRQTDDGNEPSGDVAAEFTKRSAQMDALAQSIRVDSPDEYINAAAPALAVAADALWDAKQGCIMHGAVAWRQAFAGWRGPYALDALGAHDRAVTNIRHWLERQNVTPVTTGDPATGPWDASSHLTRKEKLLHSNGDISNNHYDMNLVFIDMLLRHLMWTGDLEFATRGLARVRAPSRVGASSVSQDVRGCGRQGTSTLRGLRCHLGQRQFAIQRRRRGPLLGLQRVCLPLGGQTGAGARRGRDRVCDRGGADPAGDDRTPLAPRRKVHSPNRRT